MLLTISIVFLLLVMLAGLLVASPFAGQRSQKLRQICREAQHLNWHYRPYGQLPDEIKAAGFQIIRYCEHRLFRHLIEGLWPGAPTENMVMPEEGILTPFNLLDCSLISQHGTLTQTLLITPLYRSLPPAFQCTIAPKNGDHKYFFDDAFNESTTHNLRALSDHLLPSELIDRRILSSNTGLCAAIIGEMTFKHWLLTYPHLHIEICSDILLVYKQNSIIDAEEITTALNIVAELNRILTNNNKTMDSI